jgi:hypothetical protein
MSVRLGEITWEAIAAIATAIAVIVALLPIWRDARRMRAHARSLRIRLCSKLTIFKPSLMNVVHHGLVEHPASILSKDEFREVVHSIGAMMQESSVLYPEEQDHLGRVFANLELTAPLYDSRDFKVENAKYILVLIDVVVAIMERHGLLHGSVKNKGDYT